MNQNVYLNKKSRSLNASIPSQIEKCQPKVNAPNESPMMKKIELEPAPEVEFGSDKRKRIARNIQAIYQFSHGGKSKKKKKKK